ncbi:MAG: exosortase C-terminal domain/associated protein EpsI [Verrucomicrobiia bacterium]
MSDGQETDTQTSVSQPQPTVAVRPRNRWPSVVQIAVVVAILAAGIVLTALTSDVTRVSEPGVRIVDGQPFLPEKVADWNGGELQGLSENERNILPADTEGARRLYTDKAGDKVFCSIILAGREVTSIHRPELCLPGQGWKIENEYTEPIHTAAADGGQLNVMRMNTTRAVNSPDGRAMPVRYVFVYWFVGKGRVTPYHWQRILWTAKDRVLYNTNHRWAYVLIFAPVTNGQAGSDPERSEAETMQLITRFVQDIYPALVSG